MPILPGVDQSQVMVPSAPVAIAGTGDARIEGESVSGFGKALAGLGGVLLDAGRKTKAEKDGLQLEIAMTKANTAFLKQYAQQSAEAPIKGDATGFGAVEKVTANMKPAFAEIAQGIEDQELQAKFLADAGKMLADKSVTIWADEVKKRDDNNKVLVEQLVSQSGQLAKASPDKNDTGFMLSHVESAILQHTDLPPAQKNVYVQQAKKSILIDSIQGALQREDYDGSTLLLEKYGYGVFTPEEKAKQFDEIQKTEYNANNLEYTKLIRGQAQNDRSRREQERSLVDFLGASLKQAGNNQEKRDVILKDGETMVVAGKMSPQVFSALAGNKTFRKEEDEKIENEISTRAFKTGNYKQALEEINNAKGKTLSFERATDLAEKFSGMETRAKKDPIFSQRVQTGEQLIRAQAQDTITAPLSSFNKRELQTKINLSVQEYYKNISANPDADPDAISKGILKRNFNASTTMIPGSSDIYAESTPQGLNMMSEKIVKEAFLLRKSGKYSKKSEKADIEKLRAIQMKLKELSDNSNQSGGDGGRPNEQSTQVKARGK